MKHIILLPFLCLLSFVDAKAAAQTATHVTVLVGETIEFMSPAGVLMTGFSIESGSEFVTVSKSEAILKIKGIKAGEAKLQMQLPKGKTMPLFIHVKQRSFAGMPQPTPQVGNPGTLVEPEDIDKPESRWKENYVFNPPVKNFLFSFMYFDENRKLTSEQTIARIEDLFIDHDVWRHQGKHEDWLVHKYNYSSRLATNGGLGDDLNFHLFYDDGNKIAPENERSGRDYFYNYAPRFSDKRSIITMDIVKKYGRAEENDDDYYEKGFYPGFMDDLRKYGFKQSYLNKFYRGMENMCGVNCWVFDFRSLKGFGFTKGCWWIDPATGLALQYVDDDGSSWEVTIYELNYTTWDSFGDPCLLP